MSDLKKSLPTNDMWDQLVKAASLRQFIGENEIGLPPFCDYIQALCRERGEAPERVIRRAAIERSFGHALFRGDRKPSRDTVLQLAFGFEADVKLAQSLLRHAGHSTLYPKVPRDTVVGYCLIHKTSLIETQQLLMELGLPLIGGRTK